MFQVLPEFAGHVVACPHCRGTVGIPGLAAPPRGPPILGESARPSPERRFDLPAVEGGQAVIRDTGNVAVSGSGKQGMRALTAHERSAGRLIKNLIVYGLCAIVLLIVLSWLLIHGPI